MQKVAEVGWRILTSVLADLQRTQHGEIDLASANHTETLVRSEQRSATSQDNSLLARVDEVRVLLAGLGVTTETKDTVLRLQDDLDTLGQERGSDKRNSNTQVHVHTILELFSGTADNTLTASSGVTAT